MILKNISLKRFGKLIAIKRENSGKWFCLCDCGNITSVYLANLTRGRTKSCGCGQHPGKHKRYGSKIYRVWGAMIQRCKNPNDLSYKYYGGRGIYVCKRWELFENFFADMGTPPKGLTLDRVDNNKGYCLENCRWATRAEQRRNSRSTFFIEYDGRKQTINEWARDTGVKRERIRGRLRRGWSVQEAIDGPSYKTTQVTP